MTDHQVKERQLPTTIIYPLVSTNIAGWNMPIFNRKYIFNPCPFSIAMFDISEKHSILYSMHGLQCQ